MRQELNRELDRLFAAYRDATSGLEASPEFLAGVWRKIEQRRPAAWLTALGLWSPRLAAVGALAAALLMLSSWPADRRQREAAIIERTYVEALIADSMDEHDEALWTLAGHRRR